jgi:hypothetical protein
MKKWVNKSVRWFYEYRYRQIQKAVNQPEPTQLYWLNTLLQTAKHTRWGKMHDFSSIRSPEDFAKHVPIQNYESLQPFIDRMMHGERDVLWDGKVRWFSKSAGTTSGVSKFIPVSQQNLKYCHIRGTWDTMTFFYQNRMDARQFELKSMLMGGSLYSFEPHPRTSYGDISAIMIKHMPWLGRPFFTPDFDTALLDDWETKLELLAQEGSRNKDIVMIGGVPTWTVVLFRRILEITGKENMLEVWPHFQVYIHGGVSFTPHRKQFESFFPSDSVSYLEIYNASEGYFAAQDDLSGDDLLLLINNGVYYEFIPMEEWDKDSPEAVPLWEVEKGKNYALIISTNSGLWRYQPGDTVMFTSTNPYKIRITGRTKQFVNAFGEEVIVENTDQAVAQTCATTGAIVREYTVAPIYFEGNSRGGHDWLIEFEKAPPNLQKFRSLLDQNLQSINADYKAKRFKNMALQMLQLKMVPPGTFHDWMKSKGKLGGQNKVPRLANNRTYINEILQFIKEKV